MKNLYRALFTCFVLLLFNNAAKAQSVREVPAEYPTIQAAVDAAQAGDTVLVAPGVYPEKVRFAGRDIVLASHFVLTGDPVAIEQTVIRGDTSGALLVFDQGESLGAEFVGFTVDGGGLSFSTDPDSVPLNNGVIVCDGASPKIRHNRIVNHFFFGPYNDFGAIYCYQSEALIEHNHIDSIRSYGVGRLAGIHARHSDLTIRHNIISEIYGNYCLYRAGCIVADTCQLALSYNILTGVRADGSPGVGLALTGSQAVMDHHTVVGSEAGVGLYAGSELEVSNSILYYNDIPGHAETGPIHDFDGDATVTVRFSNLEGGWAGPGNLDAPPLFADPETGDYGLSPGSPCIDAGDPEAATDPDGTRADMGAVYFPQPNATKEAGTIDFTVFPNPARGVVCVKSGSDRPLTVHVYDARGRRVRTPVVLRGAGVLSLRLSPGVYFVRVLDEAGAGVTERLVVD